MKPYIIWFIKAVCLFCISIPFSSWIMDAGRMIMLEAPEHFSTRNSFLMHMSGRLMTYMIFWVVISMIFCSYANFHPLKAVFDIINKHRCKIKKLALIKSVAESGTWYVFFPRQWAAPFEISVGMSSCGDNTIPADYLFEYMRLDFRKLSEDIFCEKRSDCQCRDYHDLGNGSLACAKEKLEKLVKKEVHTYHMCNLPFCK